MILLFLHLAITTSFWQGEECAVDSQTFSEEAQKIVDKAVEDQAAEPYKNQFREVFPNLDALTNDETRYSFFENIPTYIQAALVKTYSAETHEKTIDQIEYPLLQEKLASQYARLKLTEDAASRDFMAASKDFYSAKGTSTKEESVEYRKLFDFYQSKGVPPLSMRKMWDVGLKFVANKEFIEWLKSEEEKRANSGPPLEWKDVAASRFINLPSVTEDDLKLWLAGYYSIGSNQKPGVALRAQRATDSYSSVVYLDTDEILTDEYLKDKYKDEPELGENIRKMQADQKQKWEEELKIASREIDSLNKRFGEILDYKQLDDRLRIRFKQKQAQEYIKHRQVFKPNSLQIDWGRLEKLGITSILPKDEIERIAAEHEIEGEMSYLMQAAEDQGKLLGELRASRPTDWQGRELREKKIKELEIPLYENPRFKSWFEGIEKVARAYPNIVSLETVKEQISAKVLEAERVSYTLNWIQEVAADSSSAEIEKIAKEQGLDEWVPIERIQKRAGEIAQAKIAKEYLHDRYYVSYNSQNKNPFESTSLMLQASLPPLDFSRPITNLSPMEWIKSKREEARQKHQALQTRYPSLKVEDLDRKIDAQEKFEMAMYWLPNNSNRPWKEVRAYLDQNGVFEKAEESSVRKQYLYYRTSPMIQEILQGVVSWYYASDDEKPKFINRRYELMKEFYKIADEFPNEFDINAVQELVAETSKQAKADLKIAQDEARRKELIRIQEQGFWSKMWDVGMDVGEALHMTIGGTIGSAASLFAPEGVNWGADYILWAHEHAKKHHNGSILGTTEDLADSSLAGLVLRTNPLVQAGKVFDPILSQTTKAYDSYVKWVYDETDEGLQKLKKDDWLVRGGYYAFATSQASAAIAATLATGGTAGMGTRGSQFITRWGPRVGMKGSSVTALSQSARASTMIGQGVTAGKMIAVSGGMSLGTSVGYELIYADKENRPVSFEEIFFNTYTSGATSLMFSAGMGALAKGKATLEYRSKFKGASPTKTLTGMNVEQQQAWNHMMKRAGGQTNILDFIEGMSSMPESIDLLSDGFEHGMFSQRMLGAVLVTGANVYDMKDVSESLEGIKWTRPGVKPAPQIVAPTAKDLLPRAEVRAPEIQTPQAEAPAEGAD